MKRSFVSISVMSFFASVMIPALSSPDGLKGIKDVRKVLQNVESAYGDSYAKNVGSFYDAMGRQTGYSGQPQATFPSEQLQVQFDLVKEVSYGSSLQAESLMDGDTLTANDNYKVMFQSNSPYYIYIAQLDSTGKLEPIFPSRYASESNPIQPYIQYSVPKEEWFFLDRNIGVETIYFIASRERRADIEDVFYTFQSTNQTLVQRQRVQMDGYYAMNKGIGGTREGKSQNVRFQDGSYGQYTPTVFESIQADFVMTRWFYHQ